MFAKDVRAKAIKKALVVLSCQLLFLKLIICSLSLPAFIRGLSHGNADAFDCGYEMKGFSGSNVCATIMRSLCFEAIEACRVWGQA